MGVEDINCGGHNYDDCAMSSPCSKIACILNLDARLYNIKLQSIANFSVKYYPILVVLKHEFLGLRA
jgi:hypothetical protein